VHKDQPSTSLSPALPALGHALAGSTGAAISNLCIYPLDLIITRLQVQRQLRKSSSIRDEEEYEGVLDAADKIYHREGGLSAFYAGVLQDTGKSIADSFLFFLFYNYLRQRRLQKYGARATSLPVFDELAVGALAGACSKFFTTPIANIVTRKQTATMVAARSSSSSREPTVNEIADQIWSEKGIQGFWSGYSASLVLTLNPSLTFFLYETFKRTLLPSASRDDPNARVTFLMAAVSKAIASTITYPFSLAKARAQVGSRPPVNPDAASTIKSEVSSATMTSKGATLEERGAEARKVGKDIECTAVRSTVFSMILHIYRTEGPQALYEGIWGEILKGFFSHGITMLVKESVHKLIIQLYYLVLRALKRIPTPGEAVSQAQGIASNMNEKAQEGVSKAGEMATGAYSSATKTMGGVVDNARERLGGPLKGERIDAYERAQTMANQGIEPKFTRSSELQGLGIEPRYASTSIEQINPQFQGPKIDAFERAHANTSNLTSSEMGKTEAIGSKGPAQGKTTDACERPANITNNATETAKSGGDLAEKEAGHLMGNVSEQLGKNIEGAGRNIRPKVEDDD
jgi:Mitochondrial carrier protein